MRYLLLAVAIVVALLLFNKQADDADKATGDHVWTEQTDTIKKAAEVNQLIQDTAGKQRQMIEQQVQPQ